MPNKDTLPVNKYANIRFNIGNGKPTILSFGMTHCYSCITMNTIFKDIVDANPSFQIYSIDGQKERQVSRDIYGLKEMPTQIFFNSLGEEVFRHTGAYKKPILEIILKKYGFV